MNGPTSVTMDDHGPTPASMGWMVLEPGGGERLRFLGASTMLIKLDGATNPGLAFYEYVSEPGVTGPPQHVHHAHDETFFVVDGEYEFTIGRERLPMPTGSFLHVPRGTPHTFRNAGAELGRIVGTFNPPRFADYFRDLSAIISATGGPPDHEEWADLYRRYETTFFDDG